jgi:uncharacterized membrane protein YfcA
MLSLFSSFDLPAFLLLVALGGAGGVLAGLFGVGGGLIIVPALIWGLPLLGVPEDSTTHLAVGTSLATIVITSISSVWAHQKKDGVVWREFFRLAPGILLGAWLGGVVAGMLSGQNLQLIYGSFALLVGLHLWFNARATTGSLNPGNGIRLLSGGVIGLISALVGVGGGTMTVPFLNAAGLEMRQAVGTSSACGIPIALAGTASFIFAGWGVANLPPGSSGFVYWPVAVIIVIGSVTLTPTGAWLAHRLPGTRLKQAFALFLFFVAGRLLLG